MVVLNRFDYFLNDLTFDLNKDAKIPPGNYHLTDLWNKTKMGKFLVESNAQKNSNFTIPNIEPHAVVAVRFDTK